MGDKWGLVGFQVGIEMRRMWEMRCMGINEVHGNK